MESSPTFSQLCNLVNTGEECIIEKVSMGFVVVAELQSDKVQRTTLKTMKHRVTFTFQPITLEIETFSGTDVAEERARSLLRALIAEGSLPIWMADWSQATSENEATK